MQLQGDATVDNRPQSDLGHRADAAIALLAHP